MMLVLHASYSRSSNRDIRRMRCFFCKHRIRFLPVRAKHVNSIFFFLFCGMVLLHERDLKNTLFDFSSSHLWSFSSYFLSTLFMINMCFAFHEKIFFVPVRCAHMSSTKVFTFFFVKKPTAPEGFPARSPTTVLAGPSQA